MYSILFLLLLSLVPWHTQAQQQMLINLGVRCATMADCEQSLHNELCHYRYVTCLAASCRALAAVPCLNSTSPRPCNTLNAACGKTRCRSQADCSARAHCDGHERCLAGLCVFETQGDYCRALNQTCLASRLCSQNTPPPPPPLPRPTAALVRQESFRVATTEAPTEASPTAPTAAPTVAPTNVPLWGVILVGVMLFVFLVVLIVAMLTRNVGLTVVYTGNGNSPQYVY